jgi:hypothetical protein
MTDKLLSLMNGKTLMTIASLLPRLIDTIRKIVGGMGNER